MGRFPPCFSYQVAVSTGGSFTGKDRRLVLAGDSPWEPCLFRAVTGRQMAASGRTGSGLPDTDDPLSSQTGPGEVTEAGGEFCSSACAGAGPMARWGGLSVLSSAHEGGGLGRRASPGQVWEGPVGRRNPTSPLPGQLSGSHPPGSAWYFCPVYCPG